MKITAVDDIEADFLNEDISSLLTERPAVVAKPDINAMLSAYDRELLSFDHETVSHQTWPQGIRKRRCIK